MSYSRDNGTTTPNLAGMVTAASGLRVNDGTFVLTRCDLFDQAPLRSGVASLTSTHGGYAGMSFYDFWPFVIEGYLTVPTLADVWAAKDDLKGSFNLKAGLQTLVLNNAGWSGTRQIDAIVAGPVQFLEPVMLEKNVPDRDFTIPMAAPFPLLLDTTLQDVAITSGTNLTNAGDEDVPYTAVFTGPLTGPVVITDPNGNHLTVDTVASSHVVTVNTRDSSSGTLTATDNGANAMSKITSSTSTVVPKGTTSWSVSTGGGAGNVHIKFRSGWS